MTLSFSSFATFHVILLLFLSSLLLCMLGVVACAKHVSSPLGVSTIADWEQYCLVDYVP